MKDEYINRAIAEHFGWCRASKYDHQTAILDNVEVWQKGGELRAHYELPNYCTDLNAMSKAEKAIQGGVYHKYLNMLCGMCSRGITTSEKGKLRLAIMAGPKQRAEAFLRAINKWQESPVEKE